VRLVYFGSPEMAVPPLRGLIDAGHDLVLVVSNPDRRRGRRQEPTPTPVKALAVEAGLPVTDDPDDVLAVEADLGVVVAYGRIIRPHVLEHLAMVNLHFSLLPRWRGAAPVERAILAGDERTGVCVMDVEEGLDTGGVHAVAEVPISQSCTAAELRDELVGGGTELLVRSLAEPLGPSEPQAADGITYASKLTPADLELHWDQSAVVLSRIVRVGGAWTTVAGRRLKVLEAEPVELDQQEAGPAHLAGDVAVCGAGGLRLVRVQPEGKGPMAYADWANGARVDADTQLGT